MNISKLHLWLKELRQDKGFDLREFSVASNFASAQVNRIENGSAGLTLGALVHFAYGLDLTLNDILQEIELPLFYQRYRASRIPDSGQPIPLLQDVHALWQLYRDEPQKVKQLLISGYTDVRKMVSAPEDLPDDQALAELIYEAILEDKPFPLHYPPKLSDNQLTEVYTCGGVVTMKDVSAFVKSSRQKAGLTLRELAKLVGVTNPAISRFENGHVERVFFSLILELDRAMHLEGGLVALAWDAAEYESGLALNKMVNERNDEKNLPIDWDPVQKAFSDTFITICRWYYVTQKEQLWWRKVRQELNFYLI